MRDQKRVNAEGLRSLPVFGSKWVQRSSSQWLLGTLCLIALILTGVRISKQYDELGGPYHNSQAGMFDFHNGIYQPALGLRNGVIPYSQELVQRYQVTRPTPAYSPWIVALHIPLTYLPLRVAEVVYFLCILAMMAAITCLVLSEALGAEAKYWFLPTMLVLIASRAGHSTLFTGYFTMELILGTLLAFRFAKDRPWLSAIGILAASGKPTYAIPLGLVLLARRNYQALAFGIGLSIIAASIPLGWLANKHGWMAIVDAVRGGQADHLADPTEFPIHTWTRIDFAAIVCKWTKTNPGEVVLLAAMVPLIAWPMWTLRRLSNLGDENGSTTLSGTIMAVSMLTTLYHHAYDGVLVAGGLVGLLLSSHRFFQIFSPRSRWLLAFLISAPLWNYASSEALLLRLPDVPKLKEFLSSFNGIVMVIGLVWLLWKSHELFRRATPTVDR